MKFGKNKITPEQETWLSHLQDVGYMTAGVVSKFEPQIIMTRKFTIAATGDSCQP